MLFVVDDWAEDHHDIEVVDQDGRRLDKRRLAEGVVGIAALHALVADHLDPAAEAAEVVVGIETDRGPWVQALLAAGYTVYAINPLQAARYRERYGVSGAKSDPGDAHVLAELVRLDRAHHRPIAGDSAVAEHVKVVARAHQSMVWSRPRQPNTLRSMLREYYPAALEAFGEDLAGRDARDLGDRAGASRGAPATGGAGGEGAARCRSSPLSDPDRDSDRGDAARRAARGSAGGGGRLRRIRACAGQRDHRARPAMHRVGG